MKNALKGHVVNIVYVTIGYIVSMILVKSVIVPAQQAYLPMITTFAALIFPLHGVRVIAAWLFGGWSILYLFIANCVMHLVLTPDANFTLKSSVPKVSPIMNASIVGKLFSGNMSPANIILCPNELIIEEINAMSMRCRQVFVDIDLAVW